MPYKLRKAPNRELYWVVTIETGKKHSKDPIPKDKAKAQKRILEKALRGGADDGDDAEIAALMAGLNVQEPVLFAPAPANFQLPVGMFEPPPRPPRRRKAPKRAISTVQGAQVVSAQKRQKMAGQGKRKCKLKGGITSLQFQTINDKYVNDQISNDELAEQWNEVFSLLTESQKQHVNKVWGRENMVQMLTAEINEIIAESHNPNFGIYGSEINVTATLSNIRNILREIYRIILKLLEDTEFTNERVAFKPQQARGQGKLKGAGSGKWTALIKSLAQMYNIPQKIVDYTITANDKLTGSKRFDAKRNNILTQFRDYLNPTVVDEISELEDSTVAEYAKTIDGRRTILNLREVQTTNPLVLKGQGKVTQRRIAALKTQIDALTPKFNHYVQQVEAFSKRTGQSLDEIYKTPSGKKILALEEKINKLVEKYNYWVSVEKGEASAIPEEEEVPEPKNTSARSSGLTAVRMLRKGEGKCRCKPPYHDYSKGKASVFALTCIDPRYTYDAAYFLQNKKELHQDYDLFTLAGASVGATKKEWTKSFFDNLELGIKLHGIKEVWCFDHLDCGMYKATFDLKKDLDPKIHIDCMDKLKKLIKKKHPELKFRSFLIDAKGHISSV